MPDFTYEFYYRCLNSECGWLQFTDGGEPLVNPLNSDIYCPKCGELVVAEKWAV